MTTLIFASLFLLATIGMAESSKTVIGYYASWQWYDRSGLAKPSNMDFHKVDRINYAFFQVDSSGNIWGTDDWADPQILHGPINWNPPSDATEQCSWTTQTGDKKCNFHKTEEGLIGLAHDAGAEVFPSLGGWTLSDTFPAMAADPISRAAFADNCVKFIQDYDWDGIDIDWEYPGYKEHSGTEDDKENYSLLLDELRSKLDALTATTNKYYKITAALPCGPKHMDNIDIAHVATRLDELNLMTYDFSGAWDDVTGVNAPMTYQGWGPAEFSVSDCVDNWLQGGGSKDQINVGLPFYGRSFGSASALNQPFDGADMTHFRIDEGSPQYFNIVNQPDMISVRHQETKTQYGYFEDGSGLVSYDDEEAICDKTEYVLENDLNGFIIWELSGDIMEDLSTPLLDAVNNKLDNPSMECSDVATPTKPIFKDQTVETSPASTQSQTNSGGTSQTEVHQAPPASTQPESNSGGTSQTELQQAPPAFTQPESNSGGTSQTEVQQAPPASTQPQSNSGTCGNGSVGNGVCPDGTCCSQWGYCGTSTQHCDNSPSPPKVVPTPPPADAVTSPMDNPVTVPPTPIENNVPATPPVATSPGDAAPTRSGCFANEHGLANWVDDTNCQTCEKEFYNYWPCKINGKEACSCSDNTIHQAPPALPVPTGNNVPATPPVATSPGGRDAAVPTRNGCFANEHGLDNWIDDAKCQTCEKEFLTYWPCIVNGKAACECSKGGESVDQIEPTPPPNRNVPQAPIALPTPPPAPVQPPTTAPIQNIPKAPIAIAHQAPPRPMTPIASDELTEHLLEALRNSEGSSILQWKTPQNTWKVSDMYKWDDMITAAQMMLTEGVGEHKLWNGGTDIRYGLVGIASFLANAMHETIQYNACDENNWSDAKVSAEHGGETYAAVSACGQLGQSYQDYTASAKEDELALSTGIGEYAGQGMACTVDPDMELRAYTHATWYGAPAPLFCAPKSKVPKAPKWNYQSPWCAPEGGWEYEPDKFQGGEINQDFFDYVNAGGSCRDYEGIQSGGWEFCNGEGCPGVTALNFGQDAPRTDVEGCCWWGRGVIQTTGVANFGKLNYYLGKRAFVEGREALFPNVDFCKRPDAICDPKGDASLKWVAGFFYHLNAVQSYDSEDWNYYDQLKKFVDGGMKGDDFINGVSGIVNRGCHNPPNCGTGELHAGPERIRNFQTVLRAMKLSSGVNDENAI